MYVGPLRAAPLAGALIVTRCCSGARSRRAATQHSRATGAAERLHCHSLSPPPYLYTPVLYPSIMSVIQFHC